METKKILRMIKGLLIVGIVLIFISITTVSNANSQNNTNNQKDYVEGEALILYRAETVTGNTMAKAMAKANGYEIVKTWAYNDMNTKKVASTAKSSASKSNEEVDLTIALVRSSHYTTKELIENLSNKEWIVAAEPNYIFHATSITNDSYSGYQWALDNDSIIGGTSDVDINPISTTGSQEKVIAVIDSGVNYNLPDLKNRMWRNTYQTQGLLGTYGYDFYNNDSDPIDDYGHGTHCAGIIAAEANNNEGISGVVLGTPNIKIMAIKVMDDKGNLTSDKVRDAYDYIEKAIGLGVNVVAINNSWGGYLESSSFVLSELKSEFDEAGQLGALSVCASGNEAYEFDSNTAVVTNDDNKGKVQFPIGCKSQYLVSVAATNARDNLATFSNYGSNIDMAAPGDRILSTYYEKTSNLSLLTKSEVTNKFKKFVTVAQGEDLDAKKTYGDITVVDHNDLDKTGKAIQWKINVTQETLNRVNSTGSDKLSIALLTTVPMSANDTVTYTLSKSGPDSNMQKNSETRINHYSALVGPVIIGGTFEEPTTINSINTTNTSTSYDAANGGLISGDDYTYEHIEAKTTTAGLFGIGFIPYQTGEYTIILDNIGVIDESRLATTSKTDYAYMAGTSMAAPFVSGAIGTISNLYEGKTALQIKDILLSKGTKSVSKINGKVSSGKRLDLTKLDIKSISIPNAVVEVGKTVTLNKTITPSEAADQTINWSSSNTAIATVTENGVVKGIAGGSVTITATAANGKSATTTVQVGNDIVEVERVTLNKTTTTLIEGKTEKLVATVEPSGATNKTITWSSSDTSIVRVDEEGTINAIKAGTAIVTAKSINEKQATCTVVVTENTIRPVSMNVEPERLLMGEGSKSTLRVSIEPSEANQNVTFASRDESIATVNELGQVKAVAAGETKIIITSVSNTDVVRGIDVIVSTRTISDIEIESLPTKTVYQLDENLDLTGGKIKVTYTNDETEIIDMDDEDIIVSGYDKEKTGEQELTLTYTRFVAKRLTFNVTVESGPEKEVSSIEVTRTPDKIIYEVGEELELAGGIVTVIYEDSSVQEIEMTDSRLTITGFDSSEEGIKTLTVNYKNKLATFNVTVGNIPEPEKTLVSIGVKQDPDKTTFDYGEKLDLTGGVLALIYDDETVGEVSMTDSNVKVSGYNATKSGRQKLTLSYGGKSTTLDVVVNSKPNQSSEDDDKKQEEQKSSGGETEEEEESKKKSGSQTAKASSNQQSNTQNNAQKRKIVRTEKVDTGDNIIISIIIMIISGSILVVITTEMRRR